MQIQRAGQPFYYGATAGRVALIEDHIRPIRPLTVRWHDGARGRLFTNEHPIDLYAVLSLMRNQADHISVIDIYEYVRKFIFFVATATAENMRGHPMGEWDNDELFVRYRQREFAHLYLFPGHLERVGRNWVLE